MVLTEQEKRLKALFLLVLEEYKGEGKEWRDYMSSQEAAQFLNIAKGTFYNKVSEGKIIPQKRIGSKPLYCKEYLTQLQI